MPNAADLLPQVFKLVDFELSEYGSSELEFYPPDVLILFYAPESNEPELGSFLIYFLALVVNAQADWGRWGADIDGFKDAVIEIWGDGATAGNLMLFEEIKGEAAGDQEVNGDITPAGLNLSDCAAEVVQLNGDDFKG